MRRGPSPLQDTFCLHPITGETVWKLIPKGEDSVGPAASSLICIIRKEEVLVARVLSTRDVCLEENVFIEAAVGEGERLSGVGGDGADTERVGTSMIGVDAQLDFYVTALLPSCD